MKKETAGEVIGHPLWMLPMMLILFLVLIETLHTMAHLHQKIDVSVAVADGADIYGEISGITNEDSSGDSIVDFGGKLGVKYTF